MDTLSLLRALRLGFRRPRRRRGTASASALEVLEVRQMLSAVAEPFEQHFDFGTSFSPVAAGYTRVAENTTYSAQAGFGWSQGTIYSRNRGATYGDERVRDFNLTEQGTFAVDVPAGVYEVTLTMGDGLALRDEMGVFLEGTQVDSVTALAGVYETRTFTVTVTDGQLTLMLDDLGGANTLVMINSLDVVQIGGDPSGPQVVSASPDVEAFDSLDRITVTFNEEVDPSTFTTADVTLTGPNGPITPTAVNPLSGDTFELVFDTQTVFGDYTLFVGPDIADLDGNLMNQDGDDVNGEAGEDGFSVTVNLLETPALEQTFDFGTALSPVAPGATRVTETSIYAAISAAADSADATTGSFGWIDGSIVSRDRGTTAGNELRRDFNAMTAGTFLVDVLAEEAIYDVTVTLGDNIAARDEMGVFLEGTHFDTVATTVGAYEIRTFRVTVADGQLTVRIEDLGGIDAVAVINSLHIRHVETVVDNTENETEEEEHTENEEQEETHGESRRWFFLPAHRRGREHWLPSVASPIAFNPPGHSHGHPHDDGEHPSHRARNHRGRRGR